MKPVIHTGGSRGVSGMFVRYFLICVARTRFKPVSFLFSNPSSFFSCLKKNRSSSELEMRVDRKFGKNQKSMIFSSKMGVLRLSGTFQVVGGLRIKFYAHFLELGLFFFFVCKIFSSSEIQVPEVESVLTKYMKI